MLQRLYRIFIEPRQRDADIRNRELVLNVLLAGTLLLLSLTLILYLGSWLFLSYDYVGGRSIGIIVAMLFIALLYRLSRHGHYRLAATLLVGLYLFLASVVVSLWGIFTPTGILLYGLVIVVAGILIGPQYSLYAAAAATLLLIVIQLASEHGIINPDWSWMAKPASIGDVWGPTFLFAILALVSWLFNYQMERSLHRAERAETALTKQKDLLETTVEERTRELQAAQLEKIQQMYRFAELGQLSTALMHDLANHLTTLTMDIESLESDKRSRMLTRAKRSIRYIDDMVLRVRDQLHGRSHIRSFSVANEIEEITTMLRPKAAAASITLTWQSPEDKKTLRTRGESVRFRQLMANLISNGIDAYDEPDSASKQQREVLVTAVANETVITITVNDWGQGVSRADRAKLFEPFFSTKKTGMGMGLFIAKQIVEEHFLGEITIDPRQKHTAFVVTLPRTDA